MFFYFFSIVNFPSTVKAAKICQVLLQISQESTGLPLAPMPVGNSLGVEEFPKKNISLRSSNFDYIGQILFDYIDYWHKLVQFDPIQPWIGQIGSNLIYLIFQNQLQFRIELFF